MKKNGINEFCRARFKLKRILMIFKVFVFLILFSMTNTFAEGVYSQETGKILIKGGHLESVLKEIRSRCDYTFFYHLQDVKSVVVEGGEMQFTSIEAVLDKVLKGTGLEYSVEDKVIIISRVKVKEDESKQKQIKGKVVDEKGEPLPGVTVRHRLSTGVLVGTSTDLKGLFVMSLRETHADTLVFSFVGMKTVTRVIKAGESWLDIKMRPDTEEMEEVIITGYEKFDKRKLTGSVYTMKGSDVVEPIGLTVDQMLQGKVPGMTIMQVSSTPGVVSKIRIRGSSSILGNREPIWVVDGIILSDPVKISNAELNSMDNVNLIGNAISFLNPQDIESINVLKDASATAIYGTKAANGVVVITTKKGAAGRVSVNYSLNMSVKERPSYRTLGLMNSDERVQVSQEIAERGLNFPSGGNPLIGYEGLLNDFWNKNISYDEFNREVDVIRRSNTDWFGELLRVPFSHTHNVSVSGGNDRVVYYVSGNFAIDKGVQLQTEVQRQTISASINSELTKQLRLSAKLNAAFMKNDRTHNSIDLMSYAYKTSRAIRLYNEDGSRFFYAGKNAYTGGDDELFIDYNVLHELDHTGENQKSYNAGINVQLIYDVTSDFNVNAQFAYNKSSVKIEKWADEQSFLVCADRQIPYGHEIPESNKASVRNPFGGEHSYGSTDNSTLDGKLSINYHKSIHRNSVDVMVGSDIRSSMYEGYSKESLGYYPDRGKTFSTNVPMEYTTYHRTVANMVPKITDNVTNTLSFYGVLRYSFANKYILNFNIRTDGSNKFGQDKGTRFLPVWSVSGRWNVGQENFMKDKLTFLDAFALKLSYGLQGNVDEEQGPFMVIRQGAFDATAQQFSNSLVRYPNPHLKWEKTKSYNAGVEFGLFEGFVSGAFEYYYKKGEDQIVTKQVTPTNGGTSFKINEGNIENKGWDLSLRFNFIQKENTGFSMTFNTGMNKNTVTNSGDPTLTNWSDYLSGNLIRDGYSVNSFYSYRFGGLDRNGLPTFAGTEFFAKDYDGEIKDMVSAIQSAMEYSGKREPVSSGGFSFSFRYKKLSIMSSFSYALGNKIRLYDLYDNANQTLVLPVQNMADEFLDRWQQPGDEAYTNIPVLSDLPLRTDDSEFRVSDNYWQMYNKSNLRVVSGDYLKCSSLSVSYQLPVSFVKKLNIQNCSCVLGCNNLFTLASKKLNGQSPEAFGGTRTVPPQRTYSFTLNVSF